MGFALFQPSVSQAADKLTEIRIDVPLGRPRDRLTAAFDDGKRRVLLELDASLSGGRPPHSSRGDFIAAQ